MPFRAGIARGARLPHSAPMPNQVAFTLFVLILALLAADLLWLGWGLPVLAMEQIARLSEWMAFWR